MATKAPMKRTVFKIGQERLAMQQADFFPYFFSTWKITPHRYPSRTLGTMQVKKTPKGLDIRRKVNRVPELRHWIKLVIPNTNPQKAPLTGPRIMAPIATGTVRKVMDSPGVRKYPKGVKAIRKIIADISDNSAIWRGLVFCFIFSPFSSDKTARSVPCFSDI